MERIKPDSGSPEKTFEFVFRNAMGNPIVLNKVPTTDEMKANTMAVYGNDLYIRFPTGEIKKYIGLASDSNKMPFYQGDTIPGDKVTGDISSSQVAGDIPGNSAGVTGTIPVADGTYTIGASITLGGNVGKITISKGLITGVQQAT